MASKYFGRYIASKASTDPEGLPVLDATICLGYHVPFFLAGMGLVSKGNDLSLDLFMVPGAIDPKIYTSTKCLAHDACSHSL